MSSINLDHGRPPTPPHHPTAGVRVLREEIENIVSFAFTEPYILSITQIEPGKSYNNRIYFIELRHHRHTTSDTEPEPEPEPEQLVLKVNGRFFGANKIENEVTCLHLIEKYCPEVPAPRVFAWSEDGRVATHGELNKTTELFDDMLPNTEKPEHGGWILMSRVSGIPMPTAAMDDATLQGLAKQLGDMVASLRRDVPPQGHIGNMRLLSKNGNSLHYGNDSSLIIRDVIQEGIQCGKPITTANEYFELKLRDKLRQLEESDVFASNRHLAEPVRKFISRRLPHIDLGNETPGLESGKFVLTHYDLSPRNVLVSGQPPRITGLIDFEFAGFFPPPEEFMNDLINKEGGEWPTAFYEAYTERLNEKGVATPGRGIAPEIWDRNVWVATLAGSLVPWDLPGGLEGEALQARLRAAGEKVEEMLEKLGLEAEPRWE